ncbi:hypothetical protein PR048_002684 [Dryococelus australis]|uniref:Uncharacterized protein n=1 Tax=Dryococelus australis TaxID=614101 RepID=A0ABQ9IN91_9NEOP|nr:hypothetical protein PR048_002684 [Dryococelus australis]
MGNLPPYTFYGTHASMGPRWCSGNLTRLPPRRIGLDSRRGPLPDLSTWESRRMMPLVGGFSRGSLASPALLFRRSALIGSHELNVKSHPKILITEFLRSDEPFGRYSGLKHTKPFDIRGLQRGSHRSLMTGRGGRDTAIWAGTLLNRGCIRNCRKKAHSCAGRAIRWVRYSLPGLVLAAVVPREGVGERDGGGGAPADEVEPHHGDLVLDEDDDESEVQVQALAEHPHVVGDHHVLQQHVQQLARPLPRHTHARTGWDVGGPTAHIAKGTGISLGEPATKSGESHQRDNAPQSCALSVTVFCIRTISHAGFTMPRRGIPDSQTRPTECKGGRNGNTLRKHNQPTSTDTTPLGIETAYRFYIDDIIESCKIPDDLPWCSKFVRHQSGVREALGSNPEQAWIPLGDYNGQQTSGQKGLQFDLSPASLITAAVLPHCARFTTRVSAKGDLGTRIEFLVAFTRKALNWRAVFMSSTRLVGM